MAGKVLIKELNLELERMKELLNATRNQSGGVFVPNHQYDAMTARAFQQDEAIVQLEVEAKAREQAAGEMQRALEQRTSEMSELRDRNEGVTRRLRETMERLAEVRGGTLDPMPMTA